MTQSGWPKLQEIYTFTKQSQVFTSKHFKNTRSLRQDNHYFLGNEKTIVIFCLIIAKQFICQSTFTTLIRNISIYSCKYFKWKE